uniref:Cyclin C-terminal domain-containing protein n=1 Tax=Glossina pallidipes TaxID=7398 RepID=A0A1B0ADY1_GLOPL
MELKLTKTLDCNLSRPLSIHFLRRFSKAAEAEDIQYATSKYFIELAIIDSNMAYYNPSEIAASSLFLSLNILKGNAKLAMGVDDSCWTPTLQCYSRYSVEHIKPIARKIASIARNARTVKLKAVYNKYKSTKFQRISMRPELYGALIDSIIKNGN